MCVCVISFWDALHDCDLSEERRRHTYSVRARLEKPMNGKEEEGERRDAVAAAAVPFGDVDNVVHDITRILNRTLYMMVVFEKSKLDFEVYLVKF